MTYGTSDWRPWVLNEEESMPFFRKAVESGINFFDTADVYSLGVSEEVTGKALREYANMDEVVLATKVNGVMARGQNMRGLSRKHIQQACEASLKRLGVDVIDLYQIHRLDRTTPIEEIMSALDQLVQQGKVRYIGASSMYAWEFMKCLSVSDINGFERFVSMQNHYNLVYREEEREMNPLCASEGVGVIPWSPLARGLLTGSRKSISDRESTTRSGSDAFAADLYDHPSDWDVVEAVRSVAVNRGVEMSQIALAWMLSKSPVDAPIIGASKMLHLESAIASVEITLSDEEIEALEAPYQPHAVRGFQA
jgi:aryl-alcohol dehydrogenase-like predicted oxidoreductase